MLKSVWLSNLIVSSLNDPGSVLSSYYRHLCEAAGSFRSILVLAEPDGSEQACFLLSPRGACMASGSVALEATASTSAASASTASASTASASTASASTAPTAQPLLAKAMQEKVLLWDEDRLFCPLYYENISSFGAIIFDNAAKKADMDELMKALHAFSMMLYSESMGSILRSYHDTVMQVKDLCVDYAQGKQTYRAVDKVCLDIYEKEFTVIVGASGSGKSSLLNVMGGMLTPSAGAALWRKTDITKMTEKERTAYRGASVGFVFQRYNLIGDLTAEENINLAGSLVKDPLPASEVLDMVGLKARARDYPSRMSGGEQQRVCIARALVKRPQLLLCDEPTGALDTENARLVITILQNIAKDQRIPVVMITHNPNLVLLADHCITMRNGRIVDDHLQPFALRARDLKML